MRAYVVAAFVAAVLVCLALPAALVMADTITIGASRDNTLIEDPNGLLSDGAGAYFFAGHTNDTLKRRGLIRFDVAGSVPAGSTISSVTLRLNMSRTKAPTTAVRLHVLQQDWGEGTSNADQQEGAGAPATPNDATWKHRFYNTTLWSTLGGVFSPTFSASTDVAGVGPYTWSSAAMAADAQAWLDNPASNFGWAVIGLESGRKTAKRFDSRENATVANQPQLTINYTPPVLTGACCNLGSCSIQTSTACASGGGTFQGNGTTCSPNPCTAPAGACCAADGNCQVVSSTICSGQGGTYQGNLTTCSPNPCPQPTGGCCLNNGSCQEVTATSCTSQGGTYQGNFSTCAGTTCPIVLAPFLDPLPIPGPATPVSGTIGGTATYDMAMTEITQQLHSQLPPTRVWGYGGSYPGPTIEATVGEPVTVNWINDLRNVQGFLRTEHYLPVDTCMHGPDMEGNAPRTVVHLHGGHVPPEADGYPEATFLPGSQTTYLYPNTNQEPATLWYHDHALGITRLNVYMGLAGFYLLRDAFENGLGLPSGAYEIPLAIQDRSFNPDGTLQYPATWMEHFFGDKILVNGKVWPYLEVDQGKYRFRFLNGSNSRTYSLAFSDPNIAFVRIGTDGGLLPAPVTTGTLTFGPGERADVIVDFAGLPAGAQITLVNSAPAPFPGSPGDGVIPNVMQFRVRNQAGFTGPVPATLRPVPPLSPAQAVKARTFELKKAPWPCSTSIWTINGLLFNDVTEFPELDTIETWTFINRSGFSHPMHMHLVMFQVLDRQPFTVDPNGSIVPVGPPVPAPPEERGWKDTVMVHPNETARVIARFDDYTGLYPYHCHILEHEDHEMMRQFRTVKCGNSILEPTEQCDDGNAASGDLCSASCNWEEFVKLSGTAQGGQVSITVMGILITVPTTAGQTPAQIAAALAAAINADPALAAMGVTATASGATVRVEGQVTDVSIADAGIGELLDLTFQDSSLWWSSVGSRIGYDAVRGDLGSLRSTGGNFTTATLECLANDRVQTSLGLAASPPPGQGWWYLVRKVGSGGPGTWDDGVPGQAGTRDAEINASSNACP